MNYCKPGILAIAAVDIIQSDTQKIRCVVLDSFNSWAESPGYEADA